MSTASPDSGRRARLLATVALGWGSIYITWRIGWSMQGTPRWLGIPLLAAEIWALVRLALFAAAAWRLPVDDETESDAPDRGRSVESVELLVPAAHAGVEEVGRTLVVAAADPVGSVRVLDTRHRIEVADEALRHGAHYEVVEVADASATSPRETSTALIAAAMRDSAHDVVVWVDAGDVLAPGLDALTAAFDRSDVAVVQAATHYSNRDSLLHSTPERDERAVDEHVIGPSLGAIGAAPWSGSGSVLRTAAIEEIGGIGGGTDAVARSSVRLTGSGWRIEFCVRPAIRVTAPDTLEEYLASVADGSTGSWRALHSPDSPVRHRGLALRTRLAMIEHGTRPVDGLARLTFLAVLATTLFTGHLPFTASFGALVMFWAPAFALRAEAMLALSRGTLRRGDVTRQSLRRMGVNLRVLAGRAHAVHGDDLGDRRERSAARSVRIAGRLPMVTATAVVLNLGILLRALTFWFPHLLRPLDGSALVAVMASAVATIFPIVDVLQVLITRQQRRASHRVGASLTARVDGHACRAHDLTPRGLGVDLVDAPAIGDRVSVVLTIPRVAGDIEDVVLTGVVRHVSEPATGPGDRSLRPRPVHRVGLQLVGIGPEARDALVEICALTAQERDGIRDRRAQINPDELDLRTGSAWRKGLAALNVVGLLTAGLVVAGAPAGAESATGATTGTSVIYGRVLGSDAAPQPKFCVTVNDIKADPVTTDGDGNFAIEQLPAGDHVVMAYDCAGEGGYAPTYYPGTALASAATPVHVDDADKTGIELELVPTGRVDGAVVDEKGNPVDGICVAFAPAPVTDADAEKAAAEAAARREKAAAEQAAASTTDESTAAEPPAEEAAAPAAPEAAAAPAADPDPGVLNLGRTNKEGRYTVDAPAGRGTFRYTDCSGAARYSETWFPSAPDRSSSKDIEVVSHDKIGVDTVTMRTAPQLSGHVVDDNGKPLANICVSVQDVADGSMTGLAFTTTDEEGGYSLTAPVGTHSLLFQDCTNERRLVPVWYGGAPQFTNPTPTIDIATGETTGLDQRLSTGGAIAGVVTNPEGGVAGGVCVAIHSAKQLIDQDDWTTAYWGPIDPESGQWLTGALPDGSYLVQFVNCDEHGYQSSGEWREEFLDHVFTSDDGTNVRDSKPIDVRADDKPTFIEHAVTRATGLKGTVTVRRTGAANVCVGSTPGNGKARTGDDGSWTMELPEGDYVLTFTDCQLGRGLEQTTAEASVRGDQMASVDVRMRPRPPATMLGTVTTEKGRVLPGVCVVAYAPNDAPAFAAVSEKGDWELTGLGAGRYWVAAINCDDPGRPMVDPDRPKDEYATTWYPSATANLEREAQPDKDGAKVITLEGGASVTGLDICLTGCGGAAPVDTAPAETEPPVTTSPSTTVPSTTVPSTTVPPTTAPTTVPPTTVPPTTTAPTTVPPTTAPRTTVPPTTVPRTTVPPTSTPRTTTTTVPPGTIPPFTVPPLTGPTTTAPPTTRVPGIVPVVTVPQPTTSTTSSEGDTRRGTTASGRATTTTSPDRSTIGATAEAAVGTSPGTGPITSSVGAGSRSTITADAATRIASGHATTRSVIDTSIGSRPDTAVDGLSIEAGRRTATQPLDELASRDTSSTDASSNAPSHRGWMIFAGLGLIAFAGAGLIAARRRSSVVP